jgi:hypothetical protein
MKLAYLIDTETDFGIDSSTCSEARVDIDPEEVRELYGIRVDTLPQRWNEYAQTNQWAIEDCPRENRRLFDMVFRDVCHYMEEQTGSSWADYYGGPGRRFWSLSGRIDIVFGRLEVRPYLCSGFDI